jgi:hypothetical protein
MSEEKKDEISNKEREEQNYRRRSDGESGDEWSRETDRKYLADFERIFSEGNESDGAGRNDTVEEPVSKDGDSEESEYEGYEEW